MEEMLEAVSSIGYASKEEGPMGTGITDVIDWQRSRSDVTNSIVLPSICLVQTITSKWPQPLPRAQSVRRLLTIALDCAAPPQPPAKPGLMKQQ
jgi:hypothetical protein